METDEGASLILGPVKEVPPKQPVVRASQGSIRAEAPSYGGRPDLAASPHARLLAQRKCRVREKRQAAARAIRVARDLGREGMKMEELNATPASCKA